MPKRTVSRRNLWNSERLPIEADAARRSDARCLKARTVHIPTSRPTPNTPS